MELSVVFEEKYMRRLVVSFVLMASLVFNISNVYAKSSISELKQIVIESAERYGVEPELIFAMIQQESGWQVKAVSHAGAIGVMQIMPGTGKDACGLSETELFEADKNIDCGVKYFSQQFKKFGDVKLALCAYNAGPHRANKGLTRCNRIKETRHYIKNIMHIWGSGAEYIGIPDYFFDSAKTIADNRFIYGNYQENSLWWKLVCEAVDEVYYKKLGKQEPAITQPQKKIWRGILSATVDDIYADITRLGQLKKWSKSKIRYQIKASCPKSAIEIAKKWYEQKSDIVDAWWKLLCKAIDELYYRKTGKQKARTKDQQKIWREILAATVDEFYIHEKRNGNYSWSNKEIRRKIISSCP
jgi:hypothetical protein